MKLDTSKAMTKWAIAFILGALFTSILVVTSPDIGVTWDEPAYIAASESYIAWIRQLFHNPFNAMHAQSIETYWKANHEHPPLNKVWCGLVWTLASPIFDDLTAHRLGNCILSGFLVALLYAMITEEAGSKAGLAAVGALVTMPRFFFHAHLAALDVPAATSVFATSLLFWRTRDNPSCKPTILLGITWGLALSTKINAFFSFPTLLIWTIAFYRRTHLLKRLVGMGLIGTIIFLVIWPWLYYESLARLVEYILFITIDHWKIGQFYLNQIYMPPPWHFPFVMTLAVVPFSITILYILGVCQIGANRHLCPLGGLLTISALIPLIALSTGNSMVYDNERLFMPTFPYLAALAGIGFAWLTSSARRLLHRSKRAIQSLVTLAITMFLFLPHLVLAVDLYPHLLSYYSEAIGGLHGAVRLGMETTYWCETFSKAVPYLNAHAKPSNTIWVEAWSHDVLFYYQILGRLDPRLRIKWPFRGSSVFGHHNVKGHKESIDRADYIVIQYRQTGFDEELKDFLREREPAYQLDHQGIPLLEIYTP